MSGVPNTFYYHEGYYYSFTASGGYVGEAGAPSIRYNINALFDKFDMTDAIQVLFDVKTFNRKIGLIKDASNLNIVDSSFNNVSGNFPVDSLTISSNEFVTGMHENQVISVGRYKSLYSDFSAYVRQYFSYGGFVSLFRNGSTYEINNGIFDPSALVHAIRGSPRTSFGTYVKDLSGSITVNNINNLLRTATALNIFGNRENSATDDGFLSGDLIFIPNGTQFTMNVDIEVTGSLTAQGILNVDVSNQDIDYVSPNQLYSQKSIPTLNLISRVVTAPLLIRLANLPSETITTYQPPTNSGISDGPYKWVNRGHLYGNKQWTSVSMSSNARHQLVGEYEGTLYKSDNFGVDWIPVDISNAPWSSLSVSDTGQYQAACAYNSRIYETDDYGNTWIKKGYPAQWSSISINSTGQHQTGLVINGSIHKSSDYGNTWSTVAMDYGNKDWKSVALSFTGQYQTAVAFNSGIYKSNDYGNTWTIADSTVVPWSSVAISSTGQYQTACVDGGGVYLSSNYGSSWQIKTSLGNQQWNCVSMSGAGQYQSITARYDNIYMTTDYGNTWVTSTNDISYKPWSSVSVSFGGNFQTSVVWNGSIYLSKLF
jgi:photosystem II stability/assembly factor-like uncharacterized protein